MESSVPLCYLIYRAWLLTSADGVSVSGGSKLPTVSPTLMLRIKVIMVTIKMSWLQWCGIEQTAEDYSGQGIPSCVSGRLKPSNHGFLNISWTELAGNISFLKLCTGKDPALAMPLRIKSTRHPSVSPGLKSEAERIRFPVSSVKSGINCAAYAELKQSAENRVEMPHSTQGKILRLSTRWELA